MNKKILFRRINNALLDMQAATSQNFQQHFLTYARFFADPSLQALNQDLTDGLDVDQFMDVSSRSEMSVRGSACLAWPESADDALGLQWLLIQKLAREPKGLVNFAHTYYTVGNNINNELHSLTRQLLIPFARDYKDYVMTIEESKGLASDDTDERGALQVTYNINGNNARVNHQSFDNSVNSVTINNKVTTYIRQLRDEVQRASLSDEQRTSAVELLDEVEVQIASGKPKRAILSSLLSSLPPLESITSISNNLLEALKATGII